MFGIPDKYSVSPALYTSASSNNKVALSPLTDHTLIDLKLVTIRYKRKKILNLLMTNQGLTHAPIRKKLSSPLPVPSNLSNHTPQGKSSPLYNTMDTDVADSVIDFVERNSRSEKTFFGCYAGRGKHFWGAHPDFMNQPADSTNSAKMAEHDHNVGRSLNKLRELGVEENTLVVWMSDNGPIYSTLLIKKRFKSKK